MPVSDFECQIARGQIGRYLDGGALSSQAMSGLEEHLAECPGCRDLVARRRAALVGDEAPNRAVVSLPVENPLVAALRAKAEAKDEPASEPTPAAKPRPRYAKPEPKGGLGKPLALAALLAAVLLGMSRLTHFVTAPSARAAASFAAEALPKRAAKPSPLPSEGEGRRPAPVVSSKSIAPSLTKAPASSPGALAASKATIPPKRETPPAPKPVASAKPKAPADRWTQVQIPFSPPRSHPTSKPIRALKVAVVRPHRVTSARWPAHRRIAPAPHRPALRRIVRRPKTRSTVRVYGPDGRPL